jgi:type IV pilus assembly protein PilA
MKKIQQGFTLIELMIVVAIIAILAAIAIPQYQDYITRSQFAEGPTIADGLKTPISEYQNQTGACPTNTTTGFLPAASYVGKYVATATLSGTSPTCIVTIAYKASGVSTPLVSGTATFTGTSNGGTVTWTCTTSVAARYVPQVCR